MKRNCLLFGRYSLVVLLLCFGVLAPGGGAAYAAPSILVTVAPQAAVVRAVAGPEAEVTVMVSPGASPHMYEPKPSLMVRAARADVYFTIGLELEKAWVPKFLSANSGLRTVAMDAGVSKLAMAEHGHEGEEHHERMRLEGEHHEGEHHGEEPHEGEHHEGERHDGEHHEDPHGEGVPDPHVWLGPERAKRLAANVRDALVLIDPAGSERYAANCEAFVARAEALRQDIAALFADVPSRRFMVFHPSWGYFADEFGLVQMPIEAGGGEPGPRELKALVDEAREHGVRAVFVAPQFSRRTASVVADAIGGRLVEADPLAPDWEANLRGVAERFAAAMKEGR